MHRSALHCAALERHVDRGHGFADCTSLTTLELPANSSLGSIDVWAFAASGLTAVSLPSSVTSVAMGAFRSCIALTALSVTSDASKLGQLLIY